MESFVNEGVGTEFHCASKFSENPYITPSHRHFSRVSSVKPVCSLAAELSASISNRCTPEMINPRLADMDVHHHRERPESIALFVPQVNPRPSFSHTDTHIRSMCGHELATNICCELIILNSKEAQQYKNDRLSAPESVAEKICDNRSLLTLEEPVLHLKPENGFSCLTTIDVLSSMDELISNLKQCRQEKDSGNARQTHFQICWLGLDAHIELGNHLVPMFVDCGCLSDGQKVFNKLIEQNEYSWTSLIQGYVEKGHLHHAIKLFEGMKHSSVLPTSFTFVALLKGCAIEGLFEAGWDLHSQIIKQGHYVDSFVGNMLVDVYSKCGLLEEAEKLFNHLPVHDAVSWNILIAGYIEHGYYEEALRQYDVMQESSLPCDNLTFISALKASSHVGALAKGQEIHVEVAKEGYDCSLNLGSTLVGMYGKYGLLAEAREVFDNIVDRDAILWNPLITAYVENGLLEEALECLRNMQLEGFTPDPVALASCLKVCGNRGAIKYGHEIHAFCVNHGFDRDYLIGSSLVDTYGKLGAIKEAQEVFNKLSTPDVVSWTALISGYADSGFGEEALGYMEQMLVEGIPASDATHVCCLKACSSIKAGDRGRISHIEITKEGVENDPIIGSALVDMYAKCGDLAEASQLLRNLPVRGVIAWTGLISGYVGQGLNEEALGCLERMQLDNVMPNAVTFVYSLEACGDLALLSRGLELHAHVVIEGYELDPLVGTSLVDMYNKCGSLLEARTVFEDLLLRDTAAWNVMISGFVDHELFEEAFSYCNHMQLEAMTPNAVTYVLLFKACSLSQAIGKGQEILMQVTKKGLEEDSYIANAVIDFLARCGFLLDAQEEFTKLPVQNVVSWTSLIAGYTEHGQSREALECMGLLETEDLSFDAGTFVCCLKSCSNMKAIDKCYEIHMKLVTIGFENDNIVGKTLVDTYAKCGHVLEAQNVFDNLQDQDVIAWTALLGGHVDLVNEFQPLSYFQQMQVAGVSPDVVTWDAVILRYAKQVNSIKAFDMFRQMQEQALLPTVVTFTNILKACGSTAALQVGRQVAAHIYGGAGGAQVEIMMENAIVDMFGRCGSMLEAQQTFDAMEKKQLVTWNGLIIGYAREGESDAVFSLMSRMNNEGFRPNNITLLCLLNLCKHDGHVDNAKEYFNFMKLEYNLHGNIMHHNCIIDLLGRAGRFNEIWLWLQEMPVIPNLDSWITVLSACQAWGNVELGNYAFESLLKVDKTNKGAFVMMANIYANANMWDEVRKIESMKVSMDHLKLQGSC